jgi:serine/threonine-protein kinase
VKLRHHLAVAATIALLFAFGTTLVGGCGDASPAAQGGPTCTGDNNCSCGGGGGGGSGGSCGGNVDPPWHVMWLKSPFTHDISAAPVDDESSAIIAALQSTGWGGSGSLIVGGQFAVLGADPIVAPRPFMPTSTPLPDCDTAPIPVPPTGYGIEGERNYECSSGGPCHLLVQQLPRIYELDHASITGGTAAGGTFTGSCLALWDLQNDYWANPSTVGAGFARGDGCRGADPSGLPMAPLILTSYDLYGAAVHSDPVSHALRFVLPASNIRAGVYVHPATSIGAATGGPTTLPYGARLRLRASFDESQLNDEGLAVVHALKTYGMFLAGDGDAAVISSESAPHPEPLLVTTLQPSDFEMVVGGQRIDYAQQSCRRTPITQ